jgi:chaperonin GroEL
MPVKRVKFRTSARNGLCRGADALADAVRVTMGPRGRNVLIEKRLGGPKITKDGVTVAREIELADRFANMGARLIREAAAKSSDLAGDGTTTATVLAQAILHEGVKAVASGLDPMALKRGIDVAVAAALNDVRAQARRITTPEEIAQIGTIASNGDREIGRMLAEARSAVGDDGLIVVEEAKSVRSEIEIIDGLQFARGYISPFFVTDSLKRVCELEEPYILIHEKKIERLDKLLPVLEAIARAKASLLVFADDFDKIVLDALVVNHLRSGLRIVAVKMPGTGYGHRAILEDIAILTGGTLINDDLGTTLETTTLGMLGRARRITVEKDKTTVVGGHGQPQAIRERIAEIKRRIAAAGSPQPRELLRQRLVKLTSGVAVIRVGGASKTALAERLERVRNAVNATRAATEDGIVPGGGAALLYAGNALTGLHAETNEQRAGIEILRRALGAPLRQIAENAGMDGTIVAGALLDRMRTNFGFDAQTCRCVDLFEAGIIDPARVVSAALQSAASIAGLMITAEAGVV